MSLENWATLAINEHGEKCKGNIEVRDITVEIYKNWLYVKDKKAWRKEFPYRDPIVMEITKGCIRYGRFVIMAGRGRGNELFVVVEYKNDNSDERINAKKERKLMIGIACYTYNDDGEYVDITDETKKEFCNWYKRSVKELWLCPCIGDDVLEKIKCAEQYNQGDIFLVKNM